MRADSGLIVVYWTIGLFLNFIFHCSYLLSMIFISAVDFRRKHACGRIYRGGKRMNGNDTVRVILLFIMKNTSVNTVGH